MELVYQKDLDRNRGGASPLKARVMDRVGGLLGG
jgi:hypothetical protein